MYIETSSGELGDEAELRSNVTFDGKVIKYVNRKGHVVVPCSFHLCFGFTTTCAISAYHH